MSNKIFLSCNEANHTCDKTEYTEASLLDKIKLNIHLIWCAACRKYSKNNAKLTKLINQKEVKLQDSEKSKIQSVFEKELAKQDH
ncbi:MAG: glycine dehydrogenase [Lacinutrix sp.]|uniref:glycine dehydrogenase n=1 Tax=Lacinutrix sp. TaxID=1937692 RepID=UPI003094B8F5